MKDREFGGSLKFLKLYILIRQKWTKCQKLLETSNNSLFRSVLETKLNFLIENFNLLNVGLTIYLVQQVRVRIRLHEHGFMASKPHRAQHGFKVFTRDLFRHFSSVFRVRLTIVRSVYSTLARQFRFRFRRAFPTLYTTNETVKFFQNVTGSVSVSIGEV